METWFPFVFVAFAAAAIAIGIRSYRAKIGRQRELMALAHAHGLDSAIDDPFGTLGEPFTLFGRGDGRGVENVLWGGWQGLDVRAFDHRYYDESTDSNGRSSRTYSRFCSAIVAVDAACPRLAIEEENVLSGLADAPRSTTPGSSRRSSTAGSKCGATTSGSRMRWSTAG